MKLASRKGFIVCLMYTRIFCFLLQMLTFSQILFLSSTNFCKGFEMAGNKRFTNAYTYERTFIDNVSLGLRLPLSGSGCLSPEGDGLQPAISVQSLFRVRAWQCLRLGLAFRVVDIPQSGLLAQIISLRQRSGYSGQILTLSDAAQAIPPCPAPTC